VITSSDRIAAYALIGIALTTGLIMTAIVAVGVIHDRRERRLQAARARRLKRDITAHLRAHAAHHPDVTNGFARLDAALKGDQP
jgi:hypothetical protein